MRNLRFALVCILALGLMGCANLAKEHRLYEAEQELPKTQIAILTGHLPLALFKVDGKRGPNRWGWEHRFYMYNSFWDNGNYVIELLPGMHHFEIGYYSATLTKFDIMRGQSETKIVYSPKNIVLTLQAEPGTEYIIEGTWPNPYIKKIK